MKLNLYLPKTVILKIYKTYSNAFLTFEFLAFKYFLRLPKKIIFIKKKNTLAFVFEEINLYGYFTLKTFLVMFLNFWKKQNLIFCKKLILKGLGFKVLSLNQNNFLELKIGFSHVVKLSIPKKDNLKIFINKNMIVVEGLLKDKVGNFANKIKNCRLPDSYKGKGVWYKNESRLLKEIKKA